MADSTPIERIAARMMMGASSGRGPNATSEQIAAFTERHRALIEKARDAVPKGMTAFAAAIAKCALKYDYDKAIEFANRVREKSFTGKNDPVYLYYRWLHRLERGGKNKERSQGQNYYTTLTACRAFCDGRTLVNLSPAKEDIFQWDENWEYHPRKRKAKVAHGG
jgi:hypothetical protein